MQTITPCLWFSNQAEEAVNFYLSVFKHAKMGVISRYGEAGAKVSGQPEGSVMTIMFELNGQEFMALNGGPEFKFTEAISLIINCETQDEIDHFWTQLSANGGEEGPCGWLKDKYGVSWQVVPNVLGAFMSDPNPEKSQRVMQALIQMNKLDIQTLKQAYES